MRLISDLTERDLVALIQSRLPPPPAWLRVGIGDDAAVMEPERNRAEVLTVDAIVEGIHFDRRFTPPEAIGHRALAVNLSDLAAMGAAPRVALLSFALPPAFPLDEFERLIGGFAALADRHRLHVAGGNLTRSPGPLMIDVSLVGTVKPRQALLRRGARPGDELYVTGAIGGAAAGLQYLRSRVASTNGASQGAGGGAHETADTPAVPASDRAAGDALLEGCVQRYLYPEPRVRVGLLIGRNRAATACMDLSDGLADAVRKVGEASGVGVTLDASALPIDAGARAWFEQHGAEPAAEAVRHGDDYELLVAVRPRLRGRLMAAVRHGGTPLTRVGVCTAAPDFLLRTAEGDRPLPAGFSHFR